MSTNLGMFGIQNNASQRYLQAKDNGETHCSQEGVFKEETWIVVELDKARHIYALLNYNNQRYLSKFTNGQPCVTAKGDLNAPPGVTEQWIALSGRPYGLNDCIAFRSAYDRTIIGANNPGSDTDCGGEVAAGDAYDPISHSDWPGWWVLKPAPNPPHDDPSGTLGGVIKAALGIIGDAAAAISGLLDAIAAVSAVK